MAWDGQPQTVATVLLDFAEVQRKFYNRKRHRTIIHRAYGVRDGGGRGAVYNASAPAQTLAMSALTQLAVMSGTADAHRSGPL